jgi:nucleoside-diphosphate-sugar epimerase
MEAEYRRAAEGGGPRCILLRGGDFLLPGAPQMLMNRMILAKAGKGIITAMGPADVLHTYAYLPDMARAAVRLVELGGALPAYADIPFAGHAFTIDDLAARVGHLTGRRMRVTQFPLWFFTLVSPFWELARELREMLYLNRFPHQMDPAPLHRWLPDWQDTALDDVIRAHLVRLGVAGL